MPKKRNFSHEAPTDPELRAVTPTTPPEHSGRRRRVEAETEPPPSSRSPSSKGKASKRATARPPKRRPSNQHKAHRPGRGGATRDEVTADLSKDPRREKD